MKPFNVFASPLLVVCLLSEGKAQNSSGIPSDTSDPQIAMVHRVANKIMKSLLKNVLLLALMLGHTILFAQEEEYLVKGEIKSQKTPAKVYLKHLVGDSIVQLDSVLLNK